MPSTQPPIEETDAAYAARVQPFTDRIRTLVKDVKAQGLDLYLNHRIGNENVFVPLGAGNLAISEPKRLPRPPTWLIEQVISGIPANLITDQQVDRLVAAGQLQLSRN